MTPVMKVAAALAFAVLAACAATPPQLLTPPDWVGGAAVRYPAASFLLGRGAANDLNEAIDGARADLAAGLAVEVPAMTAAVQTFALDQPEARNPGAADERLRLDVARSVAARTDQLVRGAQIAETWRDPATDQDHVLAVLPRAVVVQRLQADIQALDAATAAELVTARGGGDPFAAIAATERAMRAQMERAAVQHQLQRVDAAAGAGTPERWSVVLLRNERADLIARLRIRPQAAGDETAAVAAALAAALGEAGFSVVEEGPADYTLAAVLDLGEPGLRDGAYRIAGSLEAVLGDTAGQVRGTRRWEIVAAAAEPQRAYQEAMDEVEAILERDLLPTLVGFAAR